MLNNAPAAGNATYRGVNYAVSTIALQTSMAATQASITVSTDNTISDAYLKGRTVGAGMRFFKTSSADAESGTLDLVYSRDGAAFDDGQAFGQDINRPKSDRIRLFLARTNDNSLRGQAGFVAQTNYRPIDDIAFNYRDVDSALGGDM